MTQINPFVGSVVQSTQVQRQQAAAKDRDVRKAREMEKNLALQDDQLEHQVESSEELKAIREERPSDHRRDRKQEHHQHQKQQQTDQDKPNLDVTA
jgi:hypothetical protein